jgi:lipopolysaccharide/colanic/teichoic acid biosynthesis glycosyltransferase
MASGSYNALGRGFAPQTPALSWARPSRELRAPSSVLVWKRASSLVFASLALVLAFPFMALIALAIRIQDGGCALFKQTRVGQYGKLFTIYKFRTMRPNASGAVRMVERLDDRVTRMGRWLRRTHLDELPQLYNVLLGDMDLVGPRPFVVAEEEECLANIPFYHYRWAVKPGATGWAQVNRGYCRTLEDNAEKLAYDLFYIRNMSVSIDLRIMLGTVANLLRGRGTGGAF